jgi:Phage capsid family
VDKDLSKIVSISSASNDFVKYAQVLAAGRGRPVEMKALAGRIPSQRLREALQQKTAVDVGTSTDSDWAGPLNQMATAFLDSLAPYSCFDRMLADNAVTRLPFRTRIVLASSGATAGQLGELAPTPLSEINFGTALFEPVKVVSSVVLSEELSKAMSPSASRLIGNELRKAVALATDTYFVGVIAQSTGVASSGSTGLTASAFLSDLEDALQSITTSPSSRLYLLVAPSAFKTISLLRDTGGSLMTNGTLASGLIKVVPSAALQDTMILVDAVSIAGASESIELSSSDQATVKLDDAQTDTGGALHVSLWQNNLSAIKATRWLAASLMRADSCFVIDSVTA